MTLQTELSVPVNAATGTPYAPNLPGGASPTPQVQPVAIPIAPPPGTWSRDASHLPLPVTPLVRSLMLDTAAQNTSAGFAEMGVLLERFEFREIGGLMYNRAVPLGGKDRQPPP